MYLDQFKKLCNDVNIKCIECSSICKCPATVTDFKDILELMDASTNRVLLYKCKINNSIVCPYDLTSDLFYSIRGEVSANAVEYDLCASDLVRDVIRDKYKQEVLDHYKGYTTLDVTIKPLDFLVDYQARYLYKDWQEVDSNADAELHDKIYREFKELYDSIANDVNAKDEFRKQHNISEPSWTSWNE